MMEDELKKVYSIKQQSGRLEIVLKFFGDGTKYESQFKSFLEMYDTDRLATLLCIKTWALQRGVSCKVTIRGIFNLQSWILRYIFLRNAYMERCGRGGVSPVRRTL